MEKQKRWQLFLIIAVILLTVYNILPTVFYYAQPLDKPINKTQASTISSQIIKRTNALEKEALDWLKSFTKLLSVKTTSIALDQTDPQLIHLTFKNASDVTTFKTHLPRAGSLIPFVPAQLSLSEMTSEENSNTVTVMRKIPIHFNPSNASDYFVFSDKFDKNHAITPFYQTILNDRLTALGLSIGGSSEDAQLLEAALHTQDLRRKEEFLLALSNNLHMYAEVFGETSFLAKRCFASVTQGNFPDKQVAVESLIEQLDLLKDRVRVERIQIQEKEETLKKASNFLDTEEKQRLEFLQKKETLLSSTAILVKKHISHFAAGVDPWSYQTLSSLIEKSTSQDVQTIKIGSHHPFINSLNVDINNQSLQLTLHPDIIKLQTAWESNREKSSLKDKLEQLIFNEIARISRESNETILPSQNQFEIALSTSSDSQSFLSFDLSAIASKESLALYQFLKQHWHPKHPDLQQDNFPIWDYATYQNLPAQEKKLGLVVYAPSTKDGVIPQGLKANSIYAIAKGLNQIFKKVESNPNSPQAQVFMDDFNELQKLLKTKGYYGYPGSTYPLSSTFSKDFIFESEDLYSTLISAFRENFKIFGTRKYATLEFSNTKQRIYALNQIENTIHEDLLKWRDDYQAAQVNPNLQAKYDVPKPVSSPLLSNFILSFKKYFRGDERKVIHWGLDLSGGKTVQIELRDQNHRKVTNAEDITQGVNELYNRVNKMGVSEVSIREHGSNIILDFPGAQGLSASELVKASSMYFHVVNETFTPNNPDLAQTVNRFLQDIWNEAVVTNKKDLDSINRIAWKHLYGESLNPEQVQPRTDAAKTLYDHGLRFPLSDDESVSSGFNDSYSKITLLRGNNFTEWFNQSHPLLIVFNNYALEGSNLTNVHSSYDPTKGNFLAFEVKPSYLGRDGQKINPRADLFTWTSTFSKEKIAGTPAEVSSKGKGWRMAVILNGSVISAPTLDSPLKDSAMITGSFTQREINKLEADLKAGSLTFSPVILSEQNVSPELGTQERTQGIFATLLALILVVSAIVGCYRFAGVVASVALLFNLFIMWAIFQNIQATMTLAGIAGVILTMGMAVDANVLVFERIKEELKATGRLASAVHAGYRRAFSAILDSNMTTVIAALILLHFDAGPIKGFAITIIIGIVSSMFTALFMTRYFFAGWVKNPQHKSLTMASWVPTTNFKFLKFGKFGMILSLALILIGGLSGVVTKHSIFGLDFTGGFSLSVELNPTKEINYRYQVEKALAAQGLSSQEFQVRELSPSNHLRIFLSKSLEQPGRPFYNLPLETTKEVGYAYENNPRIVWVMDALNAAHLTPTTPSASHLDQAWTNISGQFSESMRNNALYGLALALLCILFYITLRFEFKYAIAATLGLLHDVVLTLGTVCILHAFGVPIQIELNTIAALMAIIGYSLNDTIIIFDRIREDLKLLRKTHFKDVMNHALNVTLSRTLMTSGTTVLVLLALVSLGGSSLFGFSLVMTIGIVYGTLSSLFIATPLLYYFQKREEAKNHAIEHQVSN